MSSTATIELLNYALLRGFPSLFVDYCTHFEQVAPYYPGDFRRPEIRKQKVDEVIQFPRERNTLVEILIKQNKNWALDEHTYANIEALLSPDTVAVVTGQQVGLFGGPLFTLYKTITTLQIAEQLAQETGKKVVPIFWLEDEDHDFEEIASTYILSGDTPIPITYTPTQPPEGAVGRIVLDSAIQDTLATLRQALKETEHSDLLMEALQACYQPGTTLRDAFALWIKKLLPHSGLVLISPDDPELKRLSLPLFQKAIVQEELLFDQLKAISHTLEQEYHAQIHPRESNFFLLQDHQRIPLRKKGDQYYLPSSSQTWSKEELLHYLHTHPEVFSPNVVLRPLMQDYLLPTALYVAGPSEIAYFAQLKPLYHALDLPMPLLYPRASATLIEPAIRRILNRYELEPHELQEDLEVLFKRLVIERMETTVDIAFQNARIHLDQVFHELLPAISSIEPTLLHTTEATHVQCQKALDRLQQKVIKAEKRKHEQLKKHLERAKNHLFPKNQLQERILSPVYFLNLYGLQQAEKLQRTLLPDTCSHQLCYL